MNKSLRWQGRASREAALLGRGSRGGLGPLPAVVHRYEIARLPPIAAALRHGAGPGRWGVAVWGRAALVPRAGGKSAGSAPPEVAS